MAIRPEILPWLRRRRERARAKSADERRKWRDVALAVARKTGKRIGLDTATRMATQADFSDRRAESVSLEPRKVDPIDELKRLIGDGT